MLRGRRVAKHLCAMTSLICFLGNFFRKFEKTQRIPPKSVFLNNRLRGKKRHEDSRGCKQIKIQRRKEIESRLRQCSAKTNENLLKVNQQTCLLAFSLPFLGVHFYFHQPELRLLLLNLCTRFDANLKSKLQHTRAPRNGNLSTLCRDYGLLTLICKSTRR